RREASARPRRRTPPGRLPRRGRSRRGSRPGWRERGSTPRGRPGRAALPLRQGPHLDRSAHPGGRDPRGDLEHGVEVVGLDQHEAADVLLRIDEGAVGEERLAALDADGGGGLDRLEPLAAEDLRGLGDRHVLVDDRLLRLRRQVELDVLRRVDLEQVPHLVLLRGWSFPYDEPSMRRGTRPVRDRFATRCPLRPRPCVAWSNPPAQEAEMNAETTNQEWRRWLVLAVTVAAQFMVIVDVAVVNVA